ncbi:hypothetical protein CFAM422_005158 [Trichoderma lentiforme]|uniref:Uncharacterized protein n=1 Tax=Trichoderma lentiforme TaxID=1567552 RepID=A0A9P4XGZ3_9HYPO|nr:hypothetical protein CFAM422_005158 [Trichoderma lentiforme]
MADEDEDENCKDMGTWDWTWPNADSPVLTSSLRCSDSTSTGGSIKADTDARSRGSHRLTRLATMLKLSGPQSPCHAVPFLPLT